MFVFVLLPIIQGKDEKYCATLMRPCSSGRKKTLLALGSNVDGAKCGISLRLFMEGQKSSLRSAVRVVLGILCKMQDFPQTCPLEQP